MYISPSLHRESLHDAAGNEIIEVGVDCILTFSHKSKSLEFKLLKASETDTKTTLHDMLFFLAERSKDQQKQLERAASTIENLKKPTQRSAMFDLNDVKSSKTAPKVAPKQPGMSVINPGSKRKKLAKGIEFD